ncbi:unnamed protein product [Bursaphelenchus xylophilus]|uniref:(pine wood nematode) hypothetical protein n=1 Tax=Bursaphelenchus xylophilus TaxID=6326 RepID=A0A1I7S2F8_BURXY|nr:unnamed protein product [Bursaphelenchus xylophilus]CAG9114582.1 unnamed protein product [Bursaphelenchus xylophilus]
MSFLTSKGDGSPQQSKMDWLCRSIEEEAQAYLNSLKVPIDEEPISQPDGFWGKYYDRLASYQKGKERFILISPIKCACYGWRLEDNGNLRCEDCQETLVFPDFQTESRQEQETSILAVKTIRNLSENHSKLCHWREGEGRPFRIYDVSSRIPTIQLVVVPGAKFSSQEIDNSVEELSANYEITTSPEFYLAVAGWDASTSSVSTVKCRECLKEVDLNTVSEENRDPLKWHEQYCPVVDKHHLLWRDALKNYAELTPKKGSATSNLTQVYKDITLTMTDKEPNLDVPLDDLNTSNAAVDSTADRSSNMEASLEAESIQNTTENEITSPTLNPEGFFVSEEALEQQKRAEFSIPPPKVLKSRATPPKIKVQHFKDPIYEKELGANPEKRQKLENEEDLLIADNILDSVNSPSVRLAEGDEAMLDEKEESSSPKQVDVDHDEEEPEREKIPKFPESPYRKPISPAASDNSDEIVYLDDSDDDEKQYEKDSEEDYDSQNNFGEDYGEDLDEEETEEQDEIGLIDEVEGEKTQREGREVEEDSFSHDSDVELQPNTSEEIDEDVVSANEQVDHEYDSEQDGYEDEDQENDGKSREFYEHPSDEENEDESEDYDEEDTEELTFKDQKEESDSDSDIICLD